MNALSSQEYQQRLKRLLEILQLARASNPGVMELVAPKLPQRTIGGRQFTRVHGKRSASLRARANRRKAAR